LGFGTISVKPPKRIGHPELRPTSSRADTCPPSSYMPVT
jgi:hypothetical protein